MKDTCAVKGQDKPINEDFAARILSTVLSVACYLILWIVGVSAGFFFSALIGVAAAAVYFGWWKRKDQPYSELLLDISAPVLVGGLGKTLLQLSILSGSLGIALVYWIGILAGLSFGYIRRHRFLFTWLSKPFVKIFAAPLVVFAMLCFGAFGILGIASGLAVPVEAVTPSIIPDGWTADRPLSLFGRRVSYQKGGGRTASVAIVGEPWSMTEEDARQNFEELANGLLTTFVVVGLEKGQTTTTEISRSEVRTPTGMYALFRHYEIDQSGATSFPKIELLIQSSQCDDSPVRIKATALIKEPPFEQLRSEALQIMGSLLCERNSE